MNSFQVLGLLEVIYNFIQIQKYFMEANSGDLDQTRGRTRRLYLVSTVCTLKRMLDVYVLNLSQLTSFFICKPSTEYKKSVCKLIPTVSSVVLIWLVDRNAIVWLLNLAEMEIKTMKGVGGWGE